MKTNTLLQKYQINRALRNQLNEHKSVVIWITGLSGSGKSTIANALDKELYTRGIKSYVLDGDNMRSGLNKDLDFSAEGRKENIRRVSEVATLLVDAGIVVITAFISPFKEDRKLAKEIIGADSFFEVFIDCPLDTCIARDVKGLYKKALQGEIKNFTGLDSPYEIPENPDLVIPSDSNSVDESVLAIKKQIFPKLSL